MHLLSPDGVHLLADDPIHLGPHPLPQRQHRIVPGGQLAYEASPQQQSVTGRLGMSGIIPQGGYEQPSTSASPQRYRLSMPFLAFQPADTWRIRTWWQPISLCRGWL